MQSYEHKMDTLDPWFNRSRITASAIRRFKPAQFVPAKYFRPLLLVALSISAYSPVAIGQRMFRITIPARSELTPVQKLNRKGVEQVNKHNYERAEKTFYKAYLFDPGDPFTLNNLGYISEVQGQVDRAEKFYQLAVEQGSYATIDRSTEKTLKGKPMMDALGTLANLPMRINRINVLGIQLLLQKRPFEAAGVFQQALQLDPQNAFTLNNLGVADEATGDFDNALKYYDAAADARSTAPIVVTLNRSARGKPLSEVALASAQDLRQRMKNMDPDEIRSAMLATQGVAAMNQNDWDTARKDFLAAYKINPRSAFSLNNRAYVAEHEGDLEGAKAFYESARKADDAQATIGLASEASAQGQPLTTVAGVSHQNVGAELNAASAARRGNGVIILRHRNNPEKDEVIPLVLKPRTASGDPIDPALKQPTPPQQTTPPPPQQP